MMRALPEGKVVKASCGHLAPNGPQSGDGLPYVFLKKELPPSLKVGLIGLPTVGKSALFQLLTGVTAPAFADRQKLPVGTAPVPDPRIERLSEMYKPNKTTYASIVVTEIPGFVPKQNAPSGSDAVRGVDIKGLVDHLRDVDAVVHVVRAFSDPAIPHIFGAPDPVRDFETLTSELILTDWQFVQTRLERLEQAKKRQPNHEVEVAALEKLASALEDEEPVFSVELSADEATALQGYGFFTSKPIIVGLNVGDDQIADADAEIGRIKEIADKVRAPVVTFAAQVESEILELEPEDRRAFMNDLGISETGVERLARAVYDRLGLISYFTVGEDEVRAWTIRNGSNAKEAAGAIHSDISRGFIRAEVASYDELVEAGGWNSLKAKGRVRLEGRDYIVQDGDVMSFRFNV